MKLNRSRVLLLLVSGIIILTTSFIIISCGRGPKQKTASTDNGQFAIDFSLAPVGIIERTGDPIKGFIFAVVEESPTIAGEELTIEAWVKRKTDPSILEGGVFGRFNDAGGIVLYVKNNEPKVAIRSSLTPTTTPAGFSVRNSVGTSDTSKCTTLAVSSNNELAIKILAEPTSTPTGIKECIVGSNEPLPVDDWTHIAGVLTTEDQSAENIGNCPVVGSEVPHLAIYIDGELKNCATTEELFATEPGDFTSAGVIGEIGTKDNLHILDETISTATRFDGVIDDLRLWKVARTQEQIVACKDRELSFGGSGDCIINNNILNTYWRLNEGGGDLVTDFSGNNNNGGIEHRNSEGGIEKWDDGWVEGAPIIKD
jgi:hypothetical protein